MLVAAPPATPRHTLDIELSLPTVHGTSVRSAPSAALALFQQRCATCHGALGRGDGPAASGLSVKPRRLSDAIWQDAVDDAHLAKAILQGGFAVRKSSAMPAHPDLAPQIADLVRVVRALRSPYGSVLAQATDNAGRVAGTAQDDIDAKGKATLHLVLAPGTFNVVVSGREALCTFPALDVSAPVRVACVPAVRPVPPSAAAPLSPAPP